MEYPASEAASLRLDAGELDHLGPLFGLFHNKLFELGRRHGHRCNTKVGKPPRDTRIGEPGIYHPIEPLDWARTARSSTARPRTKPKSWGETNLRTAVPEMEPRKSFRGRRAITNRWIAGRDGVKCHSQFFLGFQSRRPGRQTSLRDASFVLRGHEGGGAACLQS